MFHTRLASPATLTVPLIPLCTLGWWVLRAWNLLSRLASTKHKEMRKSVGTDSLQNQFKWSSRSIVIYWPLTSFGYALLKIPTPHFLFTASFVIPLTDPTTTTITFTNNRVDSHPPQPAPGELSRISALHVKPGRRLTGFLFLSLPEADGKGGRKGIIYFLVLPKAISILRVSSLHPHPKPNISLTDSGPHLSPAPRGPSWPCLHCMGVPLHCRTFSFRILQILWEFSVKLIFSSPFPLQLKSGSFIQLWSQRDFFLSTWDLIK